MNKIIIEDAINLAKDNLPWKNLDGKTILITGANGYVPSYFVHSILKRNDLYGSNIHIIALCRNETRAIACFQDYLDRKDFTLHIQDVCDPIKIEATIHFFIHAASPAGYYVRHKTPADTYKTNVIGCLNLLELSRKNPVESFLFISSVDIYGKTNNADRPTETDYGYLDQLNPRNAYSMGKRAAEALCATYYAQYKIPISIARPFQILGPGMSLNDGRLQTDFISQLLTTNKIILKSDGSAKRSFMYITDAIRGMLFVLLKSSRGESYNICDEKGEASVLELANSMLSLIDNKNYCIEFDLAQRNNIEVRDAISSVIGNSSKLQKLGWQPRVSFKEGIYLTMKSYGVNMNHGNIKQVFTNAANVPSIKITEWIKNNTAQNVILYGAGVVARNLLPILQKAGLNVIAFSDSDKAKWNKEIMGLPCIPPCDLDNKYQCLIIVTVYSHYYIEFPAIVRKLNSYGCKNIVHFSKLKYVYEIQEQMDNFLMLSSIELPKNKYYNEIETLYMLIDEKSRTILLDILNERINDKWVTNVIQEKYMYHPDDLFNLSSDDIIIDCGAYTGDTLANICSFEYYSFKKYYAIEPDKKNIHKLKETISQLDKNIQEKIVIIPKASGNYCGEISFDDSFGASSHIDENGSNTISCITLDSEFVNEKISFIKMDIEGYEMNTLEGAQKIIQKNKPILAISIYHYPNDLWKIPMWIHEHFPFYNLHIRNYDSVDIVCYAVPCVQWVNNNP